MARTGIPTRLLRAWNDAYLGTMAFPAAPEHGKPEQQFLIQDPFNLRKQVVPILTIDKATGFLTGLGTGFRVDPFETFLTAEHVLKDHLDMVGRGAAPQVAAALFSIGLAYGTVGLDRNLFAPVSAAFSLRSTDEDMAPPIGTPLPPRMILDLMRFHLEMSRVPDNQRAAPLPVRMKGKPPSVGDKVMAIGYPELTCLQKGDEAAALVYTERMYGAVGTVTGLLPEGRGSIYPWPTIEVEAHWRSGMSGGPVFSEAGEVIGIVSSSIEPFEDLPGIGYAVDLSGVPLDKIVPSLVANRPMSFRGFGVFRGAPWRLAGLYPDAVQAEERRRELGAGFEVRFGTHNYGTDDFIW